MKVGDPIVIPKGTQVFEFNGRHTASETKRVSKATVESLQTFDWTWFIPHEYQDRWMRLGITRGWPMRKGQTVTHPEALAEKARIDAMLNGEYDFVAWGTRYARRSLVQPAAPKVMKEAKTTKRTLMVRGSRWRVTRDVMIYGWTHIPDNISDQDDQRLRDPQWERRAEDIGYGRFNNYANLPMFTIQAGAEFTVRGKLNSAPIYGAGTAIPVEIDEDKFVVHHTERPKNTPYERAAPYGGMTTYWHRSMNIFEYNGLHLPYGQIEDAVEVLDVPETLAYVLKDKDTGEYFSGFHDDYSTRPSTHTVKMSSTFKGAKKFEKVTNAQASIMSWSGYLEGMGVDSHTSSDKKLDLPASWVLVTVDRISLKEKGEPLDIQAWYHQLMRLRVLTSRYGSAVRKLFKDTEDFATLVVIASTMGEWDAGDPMVKEIDTTAKQTIGENRRAKGRSSIAFACDEGDAVLMKLAFAGRTGLEASVFDMKTLDEIVTA
jgi:hypothetical protein